MASGNFERPSWELNMSRKDAGLMIGAVEGGGSHLAVISAIAAEMDKWIEKGVRRP